VTIKDDDDAFIFDDTTSILLLSTLIPINNYKILHIYTLCTLTLLITVNVGHALIILRWGLWLEAN